MGGQIRCDEILMADEPGNSHTNGPVSSAFLDRQ